MVPRIAYPPNQQKPRTYVTGLISYHVVEPVTYVPGCCFSTERRRSNLKQGYGMYCLVGPVLLTQAVRRTETKNVTIR